MGRRTRKNAPIYGTDAVPYYNMTPANFPKWRKALAKARAGTASAKLLCLGDSTTWGSGSGAANPASAGYPVQLTTMLNSYHTPAVPGLVLPPQGAGVDSRWVAGSGWSTNANGWAVNGAYMGVTGAAGTLTYTPGINCDTFDIYYLQSGNGSVNAQLDAGAQNPITPDNTVGCAKITVSGAAASNHVLTFATVTTSNVFIVGVDAYLSTAKNVRVGNAGVPGSTTTDWVNAFGSLYCLGTYAPDLTVIMLGINDATLNATLATWQANIQTIITKAKLSGDVILASVIPSNSTGGNPAQEQVYQAASLALAQSNSIGYFDLFSRLGSYASMNSLGMMTDNLHPNGVGYAEIAAGVYATVRSIS